MFQQLLPSSDALMYGKHEAWLLDSSFTPVSQYINNSYVKFLVPSKNTE
jgi:hypothetical protein